MTVAQIARELDVTAPTVCYHLRRLGIPPTGKYQNRYAWREVQEYYDAGHSMRECRAKFGFCHQTWHAAVQRGDVTPRRPAAVEDYLVDGRRVNRHHLKNRLIRSGLKQRRCEECGISRWRGAELSLALHHVNGKPDDNRLENLALLCPNCHSQTPNFGSRNPRRARTIAARARGDAARRDGDASLAPVARLRPRDPA